MVFAAGGARSSDGLPILPPVCASKPQARRTWPISAVVVDLPFVPVTAMTGAVFLVAPAGRIARAKSSMSPITSAPAPRAWRTIGCGAGWVSGTPGLRTTARMSLHDQRSHGSTETPSFATARRIDSLSSQANTLAPPAFSARAAETPDRARPKTPTDFPLKQSIAIIPASAQLQGGEADQRQHHGDDPEADDDCGFAPAELFEMMMDRRHLEDALARGLERDHLYHHGHGFHDEESADDRKDDLVLD